MSRRLRRYLWPSLALYAFFLLPTLLLLVYQGDSDAQLSRAIQGSWQAGFWRFPGLSATASRIVLDGLTWIIIGGLTGLFVLGFRQLNQVSEADEPEQRRLRSTVLQWAALCGLVLVAVVPFHSSDLYGYINRGVQQSLLHTNPYLTPVAEIPGWQSIPLFHEHWVYNPAPYGFFFLHLTRWVSSLGDHQFVSIFLMFKTLNLLLVLGTTGLIDRLARHLQLKRPWLSAYLFGANPLVLLHAVGNGHNDILLAFLLLLSLWLLLQPRWAWLAMPVLTLSVLTKYASLLALPFVLVFLVKQRQHFAWALGGLLSLVLIGILALPYVEAGQPWPWAAMLDNAGKAQHSVIAMLGRLVYYPAPLLGNEARAAMQAALGLFKLLFLLGFLGFYLMQGWRFLRHQANSAALVFHVALVMTVLIGFVSAKFHPWYTVMFLPILLLLPETSRLRRFGLMFSLFQVAGFTLIQNIHILNVLLLTLLPLWLTLQGKDWFKPAGSVR